MKLYLHAATEADMDAALFEADIVEPSPFDGTLWPKQGMTLQRIGEMRYLVGLEPLKPGQSGQDPIIRTIPGYHANLTTTEDLTADQLARLPVIETPATPIHP